MKRLLSVLSFLFLSLSLVAVSDINNNQDNPTRNGSHWVEWLVLPGEVFNNPANYYFMDNIDFNQSPYFSEAGDSVSMKISLPHPVTNHPNSFYQICVGSFEDPYHLSGIWEFPVNQPEDAEDILITKFNRHWKRGFVYVVRYTKNSEGVITEVVSSLAGLGLLKPTFSYIASTEVCDLRLGNTAFGPDLFWYTLSDGVISSTAEACLQQIEYFGTRLVQRVKVEVGYHHNGTNGCDHVASTCRDSINTDFSIGLGSFTIPPSAFSLGHDQSGVFTITVIPEWINPDDACHVTTPFNYYGENPVGNTTTLTKTWIEHEYLPDLKEANLVMNGSQSCSNTMNGLLNVTGGKYMYLPANEYSQIELELRNQSLLPANDVTYKFSIKKRNLDPRIVDSEGIIIEFVEWETTDRCYSNPANNQSFPLGGIQAGETRNVSLSVNHFRDVLNEMDYKREWDSDRSEWEIVGTIWYSSRLSDGTCITKRLDIPPLYVIFLEDVKDGNFGYPLNRQSTFYGQSNNTDYPVESFFGACGLEGDNKISSSYGAYRSNRFHKGIDIPALSSLSPRHKIVFNVSRGLVTFQYIRGNSNGQPYPINSYVNVRDSRSSYKNYIHVQWGNWWSRFLGSNLEEQAVKYTSYIHSIMRDTHRNSGVPLGITQWASNKGDVNGHLHFEIVTNEGTVNPIQKGMLGKQNDVSTLNNDVQHPVVNNIKIYPSNSFIELASSISGVVSTINLGQFPQLRVLSQVTDNVSPGNTSSPFKILLELEVSGSSNPPYAWTSVPRASKAIVFDKGLDNDNFKYIYSNRANSSNLEYILTNEKNRTAYWGSSIFTKDGIYRVTVKAYDIRGNYISNAPYGQSSMLVNIIGCRPTPDNYHIYSDKTWQNDLYIEENVHITNGAQLTLAPGTDLLFAPGGKVYLEKGSIYAVGTRDSLITFHTENDTVYWGGIRSVGDSTRIDLKHVVMKNAENYDEAFASNGGAIHIGATEHVNIQDSEFSNCRSNLGGAIYVASDSVNVINSKFFNNTAVEGGAVCVDSVMTNIVGSYFNGNHADNGSAISVINSNANIINCSMLGNTPSEGGNTLAFNYSNAQVVNSVLWDNKDSLSNYQISLQNGSNPSFYNCNIEDGLASIHGNSYQGTYSGNISSPPGSVEDPEFAYLFDPLSPCVNAGITNNIGLGLLPVSDIDGNPRIDLGSNLIDIGAYELPASASIVTWNQDITTNTTWSSDIVHVTNSITVQESVTLIINPGTKVIMDNGVALNVFGTVKSLGTETNHVVFTGPDSTPGFARISLYGYSASDSSKYQLLRSQASSTFSPNIIAGNDPKYSMKSIFLHSDFIVNPNAISADSLIGVQVQIDGVDDVSFSNCQFSGTRGGASGGALSIQQSSVSVNDCTFMNTGGTQGGGIGAETSHINLKYSLFTQSEANKGGALFAKDSYVNIQNSIFDFNVASDGGAMYADASLFCLVNNTIINNFANLGGGIYICEGSDFRALNTILYDNSAVEGSQAFIDTENLSFTPEFPEEWGNVEFQYCDIEGGVLGFAYADSNSSRNPGTRQIPIVKREREPKKHVMAKSNSVDDFNNIDSPPRLSEDYSLTYMSPCLDSGCYEGYAFDYNQINAEYLGYNPIGEAYDMGAKELGIVPLVELSGNIDSDSFILADVVRIVGNLTICDSVSVIIDSTTTVIEVAGDNGIQVLGSLTVKGSQLVNTTISTALGTTRWKGITVSDSGILRLTNCNVSNVISDTQGAIKGVDNADIHIEKCVMHNNTALSGSGGAVCIEGTGNNTNARLYIGNSTLYNNEAGKGGAVYVGLSKTALIEGSQLYQNTSGQGGAIAIQDSTTIRNCEITENEATLNGGGVYTNGIGLLFLNNLVTQNHAQGLGGGLCFDTDSPSIERTFVMNSIIWENTCDADSTNDIFGLEPEFGSSRQYVYCRISDFSNCKYTIANSVSDLDPQFIDPENGGFGLSYYSSCIDGGAPIPYYLDSFGRWLQAEDINRTMCGDSYDIGSREYTDPQLIEISPDVLHYGTVAIGDAVSLSLEITNHSATQPLQISEIVLPMGFYIDSTKGIHRVSGNDPYVTVNRQVVIKSTHEPTRGKSMDISSNFNRNVAGRAQSVLLINTDKNTSYPITINALDCVLIPIVFQPQIEMDYSGFISINNSMYSEPARISITAGGFNDTQLIDEDTVWSADTVYVETNLIVKEGVTLSIAENTKVVFAKDRRLTIDNAILAVADSVSFKALPQFVQAGIYLISSDEIAFDNIKMSNCRIISEYTPLMIRYSQIDSTYISQINQNIQVRNSNFHYSHMNVSTTAMARSSYAFITNNHFNNSPYSSLISLNSIDQYDISDNYMANYQTALLLNESGHGALHQIFNNVIEYNQYGYGIEIYHSNANIDKSNTIRNNFIGIAGIRNSNIMIQGNDAYPYQSIHNNIDAELVFAEDSVPSVFKNNLVFDQLYGNNYLYKVVHHNSDKIFDIQNNYWGEPFDPYTAFYPLEYLNFDPVWIVGYDLSEDYNPVEELFLLANYNLNIGNYLLSYDQFKQVIEMETDNEEDKKYKEYAAEMLLSVAELVEQPYSALQQYYLNEPSLHINTEISQLADYLANYCSIKMGNYPAAISWFEGIIANPPSERDSIYAFIDIAYTYMLMEGDYKHRDYVGRYPQCKFERFEDYVTARETLLRHLLNQSTENEPQTPVFHTTLENNFPNPFNPSTTIRYSLESDTSCSIEIYNIKGQKVRVLFNSSQAKGQHSVVWDGKDQQGRSVSSGVYFYRLSTPKKSLTNKMLLLK